MAARQAHAVLTDHIAWAAVRSRAVLADHWIGRIADQAVQRIAFGTFRREYRELVFKIHVGIRVGIAFRAKVPTLLFIHAEVGHHLGRLKKLEDQFKFQRNDVYHEFICAQLRIRCGLNKNERRTAAQLSPGNSALCMYKSESTTSLM